MSGLHAYKIILCALTTLYLSVGSAPTSAAETCVARSIDKVGKCNGRAFARKIVNREIRGQPQSAPVPLSIDPDLLATQLLGEHGQGFWYPISGGTEWILSATPAEVSPDGNTYRLTPRSKARATLYHVSIRSGTQADTPPDVRILASRSTTVDKTETAIADIVCVDPDENKKNSGGYPEVSGRFAWLWLSPKHRILLAGVSRSEGYAGGGGSFNAVVLLDRRGAALAPVGCVSVSRYQMFGGSWNADGTRQHPESQASWDLRVVGSGGNWPALWLQATTSNTQSTGLGWDTTSDSYVERKLPSIKSGRARK